ncbi:MAG: NAD(P)/FAD-dependent oxidoreductase [Acutalibacteraceae bacterium]
MGKRIVVAGAGHGGLVAAAKLAQNGFDVTVYEKKERKDLGYDWLDAVDPRAFYEVGLELPKDVKFEKNGDMRFYNPALSAPITVESNGNGSTKIERRLIYDLLIDYAEKSGVKFVFNCPILGPVMNGTRVVGIETYHEVINADLVIDSAGIDSPVRENLPFDCNIDKSYGYGECFFAYRAYFNKLPADEPEVSYEIFLMHLGERGISWVVTEKDCVDVLIGRVSPISDEEIQDVLSQMRQFSPQIGFEVLRGGEKVCKIPVRRPLSVMVCDGYAAVGDSAYMTMPFNGSGICASLRAGLMLADTVKADSEQIFSAGTLWDYNRRYILHFGLNFASIDTLKNILLCFDSNDVDFLFDKQIITQNDINFTRSKSESSSSFSDMLARASRGMGNFPILLRTAGALSKGDSLKKVYRTIPEKYEQGAVLKWKDEVLDASVLMIR